MSRPEQLTYEEARRLFVYCPSTGRLFWRIRKCQRRKIGEEAGCVFQNGRTKYVTVMANGTRYQAHRVAWLLYYREWPKQYVDHIDGNGLNNRPENLRDVSQLINQRNQRRRLSSISGITGVSWDKVNRKWKAQIKVQGKTRNLGRFADISDAETAYRNAVGYLGYSNRHGN